jgi:hypothetical protein
MTPIEKLVRPARIEDADVLAELVDYARSDRKSSELTVLIHTGQCSL